MFAELLHDIGCHAKPNKSHFNSCKATPQEFLPAPDRVFSWTVTTLSPPISHNSNTPFEYFTLLDDVAVTEYGTYQLGTYCMAENASEFYNFLKLSARDFEFVFKMMEPLISKDKLNFEWQFQQNFFWNWL